MDGHLGHFQLYLYYRKHCDEHPCTINLYVCDYFLRHVCWSSRHGPAETNLTKNREVEGSIPGLTQWVKDRAFLWAVVSVADVAQIWCSCSSYSSDWTSICRGSSPRNGNNNNNNKKTKDKKKKNPTTVAQVAVEVWVQSPAWHRWVKGSSPAAALA